MKRIVLIVLLFFTGSVGILYAQTPLTPEGVPRMTIDQLKQQMNNPNVVIIDVRTPHDWGESTMKIKGAIREDASKLDSWMTKYPPNKTLVFYCG